MPPQNGISVVSVIFTVYQLFNCVQQSAVVLVLTFSENVTTFYGTFMDKVYRLKQPSANTDI